MITTLSKQGGRRYPQMGSTGQPWAGWLPSVGETTPVVIEVIDTHDGWRKRAERFKRENEERKQDVLRSFNRVFGLEMPEDTPAPELVAEVESRIIKPKKSKEKELLNMARSLKAMMAEGERIAEQMRIEEEEEEFIVLSLMSRRLH